MAPYGGQYEAKTQQYLSSRYEFWKTSHETLDHTHPNRDLNKLWVVGIVDVVIRDE